MVGGFLHSDAQAKRFEYLWRAVIAAQQIGEQVGQAVRGDRVASVDIPKLAFDGQDESLG